MIPPGPLGCCTGGPGWRGFGRGAGVVTGRAGAAAPGRAPGVAPGAGRAGTAEGSFAGAGAGFATAGAGFAGGFLVVSSENRLPWDVKRSAAAPRTIHVEENLEY